MLTTHSNSTVLHFDSLNKPDLSWPCGPVAVQSLTQSLSKIQWDPLFRLFACYYALCFLRNRHTYPKSFTIVWSSMLHHNILTFHFFVLMSYITSIFILNKLTLWPLCLFSDSKCRAVLSESVARRTDLVISMWSMSLHMQSCTLILHKNESSIKRKKKWMYLKNNTHYQIKENK